MDVNEDRNKMIWCNCPICMRHLLRLFPLLLNQASTERKIASFFLCSFSYLAPSGCVFPIYIDSAISGDDLPICTLSSCIHKTLFEANWRNIENLSSTFDFFLFAISESQQSLSFRWQRLVSLSIDVSFRGIKTQIQCICLSTRMFLALRQWWEVFSHWRQTVRERERERETRVIISMKAERENPSRSKSKHMFVVHRHARREQQKNT